MQFDSKLKAAGMPREDYGFLLDLDNRLKYKLMGFPDINGRT